MLIDKDFTSVEITGSFALYAEMGEPHSTALSGF